MRLNRPWYRPENIKTFLFVRGARQQNFEGLLWGWRIWQSLAHFISSPRPMPRRKKCPMMNEGNPDYKDIMPRTTLSSADQNHRRGRHQITRSSPLKDPKGDSRDTRSVPWVGKETLGPIGEWDSIGHDIGPRTSKHFSSSEEPDSRILRGYCGAEGFGKA